MNLSKPRRAFAFIPHWCNDTTEVLWLQWLWVSLNSFGHREWRRNKPTKHYGGAE
jgi:hypothetical protein